MNSRLRPRVLLADDHLLVAEALKSLLASEFDLVGVAERSRGRLPPAVVGANGDRAPDAPVDPDRSGDGVLETRPGRIADEAVRGAAECRDRPERSGRVELKRRVELSGAEAFARTGGRKFRFQGRVEIRKAAQRRVEAIRDAGDDVAEAGAPALETGPRTLICEPGNLGASAPSVPSARRGLAGASISVTS